MAAPSAIERARSLVHSISVWQPRVEDRQDALNPNVVMIVGKNPAMDAAAQFAAKYITPAAYTCSRS